MAATNLFSRAAAYRKKHPHLSQVEAVQLLSKQDKKSPAKKKAAVKKPARKKATAVGRAKPHKKSSLPTAAKKVKIKLGRKGNANVSISGIGIRSLQEEVNRLEMWEQKLKRNKEFLADARREKDAQAVRLHTQDLARIKKHIAASKKHITALKRTI